MTTTDEKQCRCGDCERYHGIELYSARELNEHEKARLLRLPSKGPRALSGDEAYGQQTVFVLFERQILGGSH